MSVPNEVPQPPNPQPVQPPLGVPADNTAEPPPPIDNPARPNQPQELPTREQPPEIPANEPKS